ncbi:MAG: alginate O-acetyltransferase [Saprospiraceae bacterium]|nr:MAG: alginate O-acetyltransferase [Saprospiraceae bacterium]
MVFSSTTFLFVFLPLVLLLHLAVGSLGWRNAVLLTASLFFYAWGEGPVVLVMLLSIGVNHVAGIAMREDAEPKRSKRTLIIALIFNLSLLAFFKYANFLVDNLNVVLEGLGVHFIYLPQIHLPIGISFFTFQAISYIVDVYRKKVAAQPNIYKLALYISLFPQLIAGPIVRYLDIRNALEKRQVTIEGLSKGGQRFIIGLVKKVLIADTLAYVADQLFNVPATALGPGAAWLGIICYSFQIYYDFSGYSDMAIGLGRMLGFQFLENFNYPYIARSLRDFWRRWHISLSTWFRDYLYIPLGGNRGSKYRTFLNLGIVFFLCGLWHGASWNFIIWGLLHGAFLILERTIFGKIMDRLPAWLQHSYLLLVVVISWVFFRAEDLPQAWDYLQAMVGAQPAATYYAALFLNQEIILTLLMATFWALPIYPYFEQQIQAKKWVVLDGVRLVGLLGLFVLSLATVIASTYHPFIYFRF